MSAFQPGMNASSSKFGSMLNDLKGGVSNIHGKMENAGVGKIFKGANMLQVLNDAYNGVGLGGGTHAQAANRPRDAPGVQPIGPSNAGAAQPVSLAPKSAPNPFSPTATLSQMNPSEMQGPASPDVEEKLQKILSALDGTDDTQYQSRAMELADSLARDANR